MTRFLPSSQVASKLYSKLPKDLFLRGVPAEILNDFLLTPFSSLKKGPKGMRKHGAVCPKIAQFVSSSDELPDQGTDRDSGASACA